MEKKQIVFTEINKAELLAKDVEELNSDSVRVKLAVSTISAGTEKANITGDPSVSGPNAPRVQFPRTLGYSASGVVTETGADVKSVKVGDRVIVSWGTHSSISTVKEKFITKIPYEDISFEQAAYIHIATFPMAAIRKCKLEMGESAIVMGMGILGMFAVQLLKIGGAVPIIAVDPDESKRKKALEVGADYALDPYASDFAETAKKLTNGGANVGLEITGIGAGLDGILDCMALKGRVALLGCTRNSDFTIDYYRKVHGPGITLVGAHTAARPSTNSSNGWWTERDDFEAVLRLTKMGRINLAELVEETHSPNESTEIYTRLCNDKTFPLVQFDWRLLK